MNPGQAGDRRHAMLEAVFSDNPDAIIVVDGSGRMLSVNPRTGMLFGYDPAKLLGEPVEMLLPERLRVQHDTHRRQFFRNPQQRAMGAGLALYGRRADGSEFPVDVMISPMHVDEQILGIAIVRDITERMRLEQAREESEAQLSEALREKETLLKEVYHRVKNNLQVIQSLLNLESRTLPPGPARAALTDTGDRVRAMALVHQKLYQSGNLARISVREYIRDLLHQLQDSGAVDSNRLRFESVVDELDVGLDAAVPLGLLLNELITNCLKHAYPDGRTGRVRISFAAGPEGPRLEVSDDGIGLPAELDPEHTPTMGLKLASSLARQLGGRLRMQTAPGGGTECVVELPPL